jgi:hypothetical protein
VSTLEEAAHAALQEMQTLREHVGQASGACHEASGYVATLSERAHADLEALHHAVEELAKTVEQDSQHLIDEMTAAESALTSVVNDSHDAGGQGQQALQTEAHGFDELAQHVQGIGPQVSALAQSAETASRAALARAAEIADALHHAIDEAEQLLSVEFASAIADMGHELETTTTAILSLLNDRCPSILQESDQAFATKQEEIQHAMDRQWPEMAQHAEKVESYCVEKLGSLVEEATGEIENRAHAVQSELESLTLLAREKDGELAKLAQTLTAQQHRCVDGAKHAADAFQDVLGRWMLLGYR